VDVKTGFFFDFTPRRIGRGLVWLYMAARGKPLPMLWMPVQKDSLFVNYIDSSGKMAMHEPIPLILMMRFEMIFLRIFDSKEENIPKG
jgi:hypothetical protein